MENKIKVKIVNTSRNPLPTYQTDGSAGMDVRADLEAPIVIEPLCRRLIPTGLYVAIPQGYELQMRPRSGLALKSGISLVNTPGTIDSDYRGEIGVIIINLSGEPFTVNPGDRICGWFSTAYPSWNGKKWLNYPIPTEVAAASGTPEFNTTSK